MNSEITASPNPVDGMKNKLVRDIKTVVGDGDAIIRGAATATTKELSSALTAIEEHLGEARSAVNQRARGAANATQAYVVEHPWTTIGIVAGIGLLIGAIFGRR